MFNLKINTNLRQFYCLSFSMLNFVLIFILFRRRLIFNLNCIFYKKYAKERFKNKQKNVVCALKYCIEVPMIYRRYT